MSVIVDTTVWMMALEQQTKERDEIAVAELRRLIHEGRAAITGFIRQELLSAVAYYNDYDRLKNLLEPFTDLAIEGEDFTRAAQLAMSCREQNLMGPCRDFLVSAIAIRLQASVFTLDEDFAAYAVHIPVELHVPRLEA